MTTSESFDIHVPGGRIALPRPAPGTVTVLMGEPGTTRAITAQLRRDTGASDTLPPPRGRESVKRWLRSRGQAAIREAELLTACRRFGLAPEILQDRAASLDEAQTARLRLAVDWASQAPLLVLDEPFAELPGHVRTGVRNTFTDLLTASGRAAVVATNSLLDAAVLPGRVVVVEKGQIVDSGELTEVLREPLGTLPAALLGANVFSGLARKGRLSIGHSRVGARTELDGKVYVTIPTSAATLALDEHDPSLTAETVFEAVVVGLRDSGRLVQVKLSPVDTEVGLPLEADFLDFSDPFTSPFGVIHPGLGATAAEQLQAVRVGTRVFVEVDTTTLRAYPVDPS